MSSAALIVVLILRGLDGGTAVPPRSAAAGDRIARVTGGLVPLVERRGATPLRHQLAARMRQLRVPGVSVAVVEGGQLVWARGFGVLEAGRPAPVTPSTMFQAGSISKPIAATATLRLVEQGQLALDQNVNHYLKSWKLPDNRFTAREKVTLRRLLSHTAGLTVPSFRGYGPEERLPTVAEILDGKAPANTDPVRVDVVPGSTCRYSGGGVMIEQLILMEVTQEPFPVLARRLVFAPIGMPDSSFEQKPPSPRGEVAAAHDSAGAPFPGRHFRFPEMAAAGLWSTPGDLLRWAMAIAAARAGRPDQILSPAMATEMLARKKLPVGLGPFVQGSGRALSFGHQGWNPGFHSRVSYFPESGQGAAVMANGDGGGRAIVRELLSAIADEYGWPGERSEIIDPIPVTARGLDAVVGTYEGMKPHAWRVRAVVRRDGDRLFLDAPVLGATDELVFIGERELISLDRADRFTVLGGKGGRAAALLFGDLKLSRRPTR